jgi:hypothetical protein
MMLTGRQFDQLRSLKNYDKFENGSEVQKLLKKCKDMARVVKAERPINSYTLPDFKSHVPPRETSDQLVHLYFRTFESTSRVLHRGLFFQEYEQYWSNPAAGSTSFVIKLLLVMAIGAALYDDGTTRNSLRSLAPQWIYSAQTWLSSPFEKSRLNLAGLEIECLLILARQTHSLNGDLIWVTVGSLVRTAMSMGLHRDPSHFPKIPVLQAELRRRLWATAIELATQCSLDCGMPPMFSFYEFDCEPPSNYDDEDLDEQTKNYPPRKPDSVFTDTSIQITLLRSLRTRLEICRLINDFRSNPPYEKVLSLSTELTSHIRSHSQLYHASKSTKHRFTTSHKNLLDLLSRRFILALHHPFAVQARTDPRYYFSRKMALDTSMIILSHPETGDSSAEDFTRMRLISWGLFKEVISRCSTAVALELITQINEDSSISTDMPGSSAGSISRKPLHDAVEMLVSLARRRVEFGVETNVKCYLFLSLLQAQTRAMERGEDVLGAITVRAKVAAEEAYGLLRKQVTHTPVDGPTPASRGDGVSEGTAESNVDWDFLVSGQ